MNLAIRHTSLSVIGALSILHASSVFAQDKSFFQDKTTLSLTEGGQGTIAIRPNVRPNGNMAVEVSASPSTGLTIAHRNPKTNEASGKIRFDQWGQDHAWNQTESVTITAAQDGNAISDTYTITFTGVKGPSDGSNPNAPYTNGNDYEDVTATVTVTVTEDNSEGITVSSAAVDLAEGGSAGSFTVALDTAPASSASLSVTSGDTEAVTVSPATLTFSSTNYASAQTVTVTPVQDNDDTDESVDIAVSVTSGYDASADTTKTVSVDDDDKIIVEPSTVSITEGGSTGSFTVKLNRAPTSSASLSVTSGDTGAVTVDKATLTFSSSNYASAQTVTVTPVSDDDAQDENVTITLSVSSGYAPVNNTVAVTVSDDDEEGITLSSDAVSVNEGGNTGSFTVTLDAAPASSASLSVTSGDTGAVTVSPATLTFTPSNYAAAQTVTVTAVQDSDDTDEEVTITVSPTSGYPGASSKTKTISVTDDDVIMADPLMVSITEGSTGSFTVKLGRAPTSNATLSVTSGDTGAVTVEPATLTFTPSNYDTAQTVTLTPVDDDNGDNEDVTITLAVSGGGYSAAADVTVAATVNDDDEEAIEVNTATVSLAEGGSDGKFTVTLGTAPTSSTTFSVTSGDMELVTVSPATLTFTSADYDTAQEVTLTPMHDDDSLDTMVTITLASTSQEFVVADKTVTVTVKDDDAPSGTIVLSGPASLNITETTDKTMKNGENAFAFTVKIEGLPKTDVISDMTVSVVSSDPGAVTVAPSSLKFTKDDLGVPQMVTVTSVADDDHQHESVDIVVSGSNGITTLRVAKRITVRDTDKPDGSIILDSAEDLDIAVGGSAHFTVRLSDQPNARVTVALSLHLNDATMSLAPSDDIITLTPASLTFSSNDWIEPKRVEVSVAPNIVVAPAENDKNRIIKLIAEGGIQHPEADDSNNLPITAQKVIRPSHIPLPEARIFFVLPDETLRVDEGSSGSFGVRIVNPAPKDTETPPTENVVVRLSNANPDITLTPELLTFTPTTVANPSASWARWDETITVSVDALSDSDMQNDRDVIVLSAAGFIAKNVRVEVNDTSGSDWPMKAWALALPPPTVQDDATLRVGCKQDHPCFVYLDCGAQSDDSTYQGVIPDPIPARGSTTFTAADIARHTGGVSWDGHGRLGCALRSAGNISAQVWTRSGDGVLVNNSAMIRSVPEGERHRADIESISSPDSPDKANIRIHCIAPVEDCTDTRFSCYDDYGMMYDFELGRIRNSIVRHLQSEELAMRILHRWRDLELSCEVRSDSPFTVQVLSRTGGGGALVNNSATGN